MTLLSSERSLLIRSKFRSVLQLRIQNRRQQKEMCGDPGVTASCPDKAGEEEARGGAHQTVDGTTLKSPPSGLTAETAKDRASGGPQKQKKARLVEDLSEKTQRRAGPLELLQKRILPLENPPVSFTLASDVFEDDISSCSPASPEQLGLHQSPGFSSSPGLSSDQSLSDGSPAATPNNSNSGSVQASLALLPAADDLSQSVAMTVAGSNSMATSGKAKGLYIPSQTTPVLPKTAHSILGGSLATPYPPRPRKPRDCKPKMRKLKYHQYIPPDQRGGAGGGSGNNSQKKKGSQSPPIDPAYSHLLQQQQVFLQLQILNQQQQVTVATSSESQVVRFSGAVPQSCPQPVPPATNPTPLETSPTHKIELLPPNLDDLTVSELRQQLRKRGLPVSGTKPALLERLRPFQMPRPQLTPAPLCHLEATLEPSPSLSPSNGDVSSSPSHIYVQSSAMVEQGLPAVVSYLTSPSSSAGSSPSLQAPSPPQPLGTLWRPDQAAEELSVELEMRERIRSRPREKALNTATQPPVPCGASLHLFLQQDPGCLRGKSSAEGEDALLAEGYSCQPCDTIGQDFELPMQITASPGQAPPTSGRSLEELLQEAIQRVQMEPSESIDDILEGTVGSPDFQLPTTVLLGSLTPPPDQSQPSQGNSKDDRVLPSPLCSSLLLELPPSPTNAPGPLTSNPAPPPPLPPHPFCTTPPLCTGSRKRRSFDAADWLESLTSGLHPLTPPPAPFVESDFGLDSDLNVNRVLDLMVEQW